MSTKLKAFFETDFTEDLKKIDIPILVIYGEDDQVVPIKVTGLKALIRDAWPYRYTSGSCQC